MCFSDTAKGHKGHIWSSQNKLRKRGVYAGDFLFATNILLFGKNYEKVALLFRFMNLGMVSRVQFERIQALYAVHRRFHYIIEVIQAKCTNL